MMALDLVGEQSGQRKRVKLLLGASVCIGRRVLAGVLLMNNKACLSREHLRIMLRHRAVGNDAADSPAGHWRVQIGSSTAKVAHMAAGSTDRTLLHSHSGEMRLRAGDRLGFIDATARRPGGADGADDADAPVRWLRVETAAGAAAEADLNGGSVSQCEVQRGRHATQPVGGEPVCSLGASEAVRKRRAADHGLTGVGVSSGLLEGPPPPPHKRPSHHLRAAEAERPSGKLPSTAPPSCDCANTGNCTYCRLLLRHAKAAAAARGAAPTAAESADDGATSSRSRSHDAVGQQQQRRRQQLHQPARTRSFADAKEQLGECVHPVRRVIHGSGRLEIMEDRSL
jgi:hypothetical protein